MSTYFRGKLTKCYFMLVLIPIISSNKTTVLNVGVLLPFSESHPIGPSIASAYYVGLNTAHKLNLLSGYEINFVWKDTACKNLRGMASAYSLYEMHRSSGEINGFIGPICCVVSESVAIFAGAIDIPMITFGCPYPTTIKRSRMPTLSSIFGGTVDNTAVLFDQLIDHFSWRRLAVVTTVESVHAMALAEAVVEHLVDSKKTVLDVRIKSSVRADVDNVDPENFEKMRGIVEYLKNEARIIVMLMDNSDVLNFLMLSLEAGMMNGDYAFITTDMAIDHPSLTSLPYEAANINQVLRSLFSVDLDKPGIAGKSEWIQFSSRMQTEFNRSEFGGIAAPQLHKVHPLAGYLHDAVVVWAAAVTVATHTGVNYDDGVEMRKIIDSILANDGPFSEKIRGSLLYGLNNVPNYTFSRLTGDGGRNVLLKFDSAHGVLHRTGLGHSSSRDQIAIKDYPKCGWDNEHCRKPEISAGNMVAVICACLVAVAVIVGVVVISVIFQGKLKLKKLLDPSRWKIHVNEIQTCEGDDVSVHNEDSEMISGLMSERKSCGRFGMYKGEKVALKIVARDYVNMNDQETIDEIRQMLETQHPNLNPFLGLCVDVPVAVVTKFAQKGSLWDVLHNEDVKLVWMFKISIAEDIAAGMQYLHRSTVGSNGNLHSMNCVVDSRWTCKITDYGLTKFRGLDTMGLSLGSKILDVRRRRISSAEGGSGRRRSLSMSIDKIEEFPVSGSNPSILNFKSTREEHIAKLSGYQQQWFGINVYIEMQGGTVPSCREKKSLHDHEQLWLSPELLRQPLSERPINGTREADVYAFGIIMQEISLQDSPFAKELQAMTVDVIVGKVVNNEDRNPFRPYVSPVVCDNVRWNKLMTSCWNEEPHIRPNFKYICTELKAIVGGKTMNVVDRMMKLLVHENELLEGLVNEREQQLDAEQRRMQSLVECMLPREIARSLEAKVTVEPEAFDNVTVFYSDIVGFTSLSAELTPIDVVNLLSCLYSTFDRIIDSYDVCKVEVIGDAYVVASGVPHRNGIQHAAEITTMALHFLSAISQFQVPSLPDRPVLMRIGIHSGPVVGGVVGSKVPHYCLFGETMITAERLETSCESMNIQISENTKVLLDNSDEGFSIVYRGKLNIKGMPEPLKTYYVVDKEGFDLPLPPMKAADTSKGHDQRRRSIIMVDPNYRLITDPWRRRASAPQAQNLPAIASLDVDEPRESSSPRDASTRVRMMMQETIDVLPQIKSPEPKLD